MGRGRGSESKKPQPRRNATGAEDPKQEIKNDMTTKHQARRKPKKIGTAEQEENGQEFEKGPSKTPFAELTPMALIQFQEWMKRVFKMKMLDALSALRGMAQVLAFHPGLK